MGNNIINRNNPQAYYRALEGLSPKGQKQEALWGWIRTNLLLLRPAGTHSCFVRQERSMRFSSMLPVKYISSARVWSPPRRRSIFC